MVLAIFFFATLIIINFDVNETQNPNVQLEIRVTIKI